MRSSVEDRVFVPPLPVSLNELKQRITTSVASVDEDKLRSVWTESGIAIAQWLSCCATNRKVAGSVPDGVIGNFSLT